MVRKYGMGKCWVHGSLLVIAVMVLSLGPVVLCGAQSVVTYVNAQDLWSLDPNEDTQGTSDGIFHNIFDPLWRIGWDPVEPVPALAESWEYTDDVTLLVHLRQGVTWHDGEPFTADDVVHSFRRASDPEVGRYNTIKKANLAHEGSVEKVDDYTVIFHFTAPYAPGGVGLQAMFIMPEHIDPEEYVQNAVGTGAYKLDEHRPNEYVKMVVNEDWWGWGVEAPREGRPDIVYYRPVPEDYSRYAMLVSNEADIVGYVLPERADTIRNTPGMTLKTIQSIRIFYVQMNIWHPPFDDRKVRQALNYAVDMDAIIDNILGGLGTTHTGVCAVADFGYDADIVDPYPYDPTKARELLAEAGYPDGFKVTFWSPRGKYPKDLEISEAIAGYLRNVGLDVDVFAPAWPEFWASYQALEMDIWLLSYGGYYPECGDKASGRLELGAGGLAYNHPFSDRLLLEQRSTVDPIKRLEIWRYLNIFFHAEAPYIFGWDGNLTYGVLDRVNWDPVPLEHVYFWDVVVND